MDKTKAFNNELKEEINKIFADLAREIGNNRQQLAFKVLGVQKEINRELSKGKVDAKQEKEIRSQVSGIIKIASQQLPHLKMNAPPPPQSPVAKTPAVPATKPPKSPASKPAKTPAAKSRKVTATKKKK